jgi:chromosome segregation ATPase
VPFRQLAFLQNLKWTFLKMQNPLQIAAIIIISCVFFIGLRGINSKGKTLSSISSNAPTVLTSFGIFFTFLGILIALNNFDVRDVNDSVPRLLDGLKLAFLSSVVGLGSGLLFRFLAPALQKESSFQDATAGDLLQELKEITRTTMLVREALVGEGDSSLSTQFSKLRNDFRDFAEKISEDSSKALIEALEAVIKDFNEKISEQFGENFKQLNTAVGGLLDWQQEYKEQVKQLTEAFIETQKGIAAVQTSVEMIETTTQRIPQQMEAVESVFEATDERMKQLYEGLSSLDDLRQNAESAVPFIQEQLSELTEGLKTSIEDELSSIDKQLNLMRDAQSDSQAVIKELTSGLNDLMKESLSNSETMYHQQKEKLEGVLDSLNMSADNVLDSTQKVGEQIEAMIKGFADDQRASSDEIKRRINETLADNTETMNQSFQALDQGMQEQLQRSLDKMGNNLVSITDRFVETYEQSASKIVDLTSRITRN